MRGEPDAAFGLIEALTTATGRVRALGTVVSLGRRVAFAEARLTDASGTLYASATSTLLILERPVVGLATGSG